MRSYSAFSRACSSCRPPRLSFLACHTHSHPISHPDIPIPCHAQCSNVPIPTHPPDALQVAAVARSHRSALCVSIPCREMFRDTCLTQFSCLRCILLQTLNVIQGKQVCRLETLCFYEGLHTEADFVASCNSGCSP